MLFNYKAIDQNNQESQGSIEAVSMDIAISSLQRRGLVISSITPEKTGMSFGSNIKFFGGVKNKDVVLLSRQLATLFQAQVSALQVFRLLAAEAPKPSLAEKLLIVADDLQGGSSISRALAKHPEIFSDFYVNMVKAGEEAGKLDETFGYLADYLERSYEVVSKARSAFIYPIFVIVVFIAVMVLMLVAVIPNLTSILKESGQPIPVYTQVVIGISNLFLHYGIYVLVVVVLAGFGIWRWSRTDGGAYSLDLIRLKIPYLGTLYTKLYLSRIADNMNTMLQSAIPIVKALETTAAVVGSKVYGRVLDDAVIGVKTGKSVSESLGKHPEIPGIMTQMMRVGEETGELGNILKTLARFYTREVTTAVDTLVSLIEPAMVVALGLGVGFLLASVLLPIYNISASQ